ncbi:hypothetical protein B0T22DRAFT_481040 [Podospora appendiculata]|uniref:Uncharacterized protein n=1 Tax=Podospora appendiculata TaxID=314037 RepID=A0AAE0XC00_9PEZI|nr:hypothetical protein B0T22DRAFT_481040 [Podospora appendiculata]
MAQPAPPFGSNNPFRRKPPSAPAAVAPPAPAPALVPGAYPESLASISVTTPDSAAALAPALLSSDHFRTQLQSQPQSAQPPPTTSFQKAKVVKKVRVQSPPPSSPESAGVPDRYPPIGDDDDDSTSSSDDDDDDAVGSQDPFSNVLPSDPSDQAAALDGLPQLTSHGPPPNPFQKTLKDMELGPGMSTQSPNRTPGARGTMDVDAFRRLLLTGQSGELGISQPAASNPGVPPAQLSPHPTTPGADGASITDASSISRQSIFDATYPVQDTPRTSHEASEPEPESDQRGLLSNSLPKIPPPPITARRKPPPPSSRHGKLIKLELGQAPSQAPTRDGIARPMSSSSLSNQTGLAVAPPLVSPPSQPQSPPSDINKPLPPAPSRFSPDGVAESIFDREAAGKVPEIDTDPDTIAMPPPRPPTPPNHSHATSSTGATVPHPPKKPAPPPRRQPHGRSDSKLSTITTSSPAPQPEDPDPLRRSSMDSTRSISSSLRINIHAPAPPPPRRSSHMPRSANSFVSPSSASLSSIASGGTAERSPSEAADSSPFTASSLPGELSKSSLGATTSGGGSPLHGMSSTPENLYAHSHSAAQSHTKLAPPPPPARNPSVRSKRPTSVSSLDATSRRNAAKGKEPGASSAPIAPPPPPRLRGSSRGSLDGPGAARRASGESVRVISETLTEEPGGVEEVTGVVETAPVANDILADLDKLQREVDALRGQFEKGGGGA